MHLASDLNLAKAFEQGLADPESLSDDDAVRFTWIVRTLMNIYLNLHNQYIQGAYPKHQWLRVVRELKGFYDQSPGLQRFRKTDPTFEELFEYIDQMDDDDYVDMRAFHDLRKEGS